MARKITLYGILTAFCIVLGYIESLFPLLFIAPGVKLGLSNAAVLLLIAFGDIKGALAVNTSRILLNGILFSGFSSLLFSLSGAMGSMLIMILLCKIKQISIIGCSIAGGAVHNILQGAVAVFIMGKAVFYYFPILIICGGASGAIIGISTLLLKKHIKSDFFKKIETKR
ncbi:MAG: Gx transporter family protein [Ruminococcaceae bacterium]|nr:Gx transporter family protein [Oscillospiraceae bacterium]